LLVSTPSLNLVKGSSVTGTAAADSLTTNTGAITGAAGDYIIYAAGAGNDLITTTLAALNNTSAGNASVKIDGGLGTDTVATNVGTYLDDNFQYVTNVETISVTGSGSLSITSGGFFDSNFRTNGVTISDTAFGVTGGGSAATATVNLNTFTGNATVTLTQNAAGDSNVADQFVVTTGTGNDTINLTTTLALTTANTVTTGAGNDTVTLTNAALGAGSITVNLGSGNDTITTGAAAVTTTGGTGADTFTFGAGVNTIVQTMGDSVAATANTFGTTIVNGNTITFGNGVDVVVSGFTSGTDRIDADIAGATSLVNAIGQLSSQVQTGNYYMRGDYANGTFTASATGADTLLSLGKDASTLTFANATDYVVLVGVTSVAAGDII
jgi:hypothetical protein